MTLEEAIEVLIIFRRQESKLLGNEFAEATAICIEAGKRELAWRPKDPSIRIELLPGETKD